MNFEDFMGFFGGEMDENLWFYIRGWKVKGWHSVVIVK